jgi:hypothetical protein
MYIGNENFIKRNTWSDSRSMVYEPEDIINRVVASIEGFTVTASYKMMQHELGRIINH